MGGEGDGGILVGLSLIAQVRGRGDRWELKGQAVRHLTGAVKLDLCGKSVVTASCDESRPLPPTPTKSCPITNRSLAMWSCRNSVVVVSVVVPGGQFGRSTH